MAQNLITYYNEIDMMYMRPWILFRKTQEIYCRRWATDLNMYNHMVMFAFQLSVSYWGHIFCEAL